MSNLIEKLRQLLKQTLASNQHNTLDEAAAVRLMQLLDQKAEESLNEALNCEETFALLDEFTELVAGGQEAAKLMPLVEHHLQMCPDCRERFEVLLQILQGGELSKSQKVLQET